MHGGDSHYIRYVGRVEHLLWKLLQTVLCDKEHFFVGVKAYVTNCTQGNYIHA